MSKNEYVFYWSHDKSRVVCGRVINYPDNNHVRVTVVAAVHPEFEEPPRIGMQQIVEIKRLLTIAT